MDLDTTITLNDGARIPQFGLGVFRSKEGKPTSDAVRWAIEAGYRHIDTARIYGNEKSVGEGVRHSGVDRKDLFVTTKLWNDDMRAGRQQKAIDESLRDLKMDYVDLYLIHWPVENFVESWLEMEKILASGKAKTIGVSNFKEHHLDTLLEQAKVVPAVNQVELHPPISTRSRCAPIAPKKASRLRRGARWAARAAACSPTTGSRPSARSTASRRRRW